MPGEEFHNRVREERTETAEQRAERARIERLAGIAVCRHAEGADDAVQLLAMLGLAVPPKPAAESVDNSWKLVDSERARARIQHLRDHDISMVQIAEKAGVAHKTVYSLLESQTARSTVVERICALHLDDFQTPAGTCDQCGGKFTPRNGFHTRCRSCSRGEVPADKARQRLHDLHAWLGTWDRVAAAISVNIATVRLVAHLDESGRIQPRTERRILAVEVPVRSA